MDTNDNNGNESKPKRVNEPPVSIVGEFGRNPERTNGTAGEDGGDGGDSSGPAYSTAGITDSGDTIAGVRVGNPASGSTDGNAPYGYTKDGRPAKKRGRPRGPGSISGPKQGKKSAPRINGLERLLYSMHAMVAIKFKTPEMALDNSESKLLADAINAVQEHYGFDVSPEVAIWINLVSALGTVYGPRALVIYNKKKIAKNSKNDPKPNNVSPITEGKKKESSVIFNIPGMHTPATDN